MRTLAVATAAAALVTLLAAPASADPVNQPPVAVDDTVALRSTAMSQWVWPLSNDSDPDGDPLTYTAVTSGTKGTVSVDTAFPTTLRYQPLPGTTAGTDSFTYTVSDGQGHTATATVTVTLWDDPGVPGNLTISSAGPDAVTLSWTPAAGATRYRVHRAGGAVIETTGTTVTDTGFADVNSYTWNVGAVNGGGFEGSWSNGVYRSYPLNRPSSLTVEPTDDPTTLSLQWTGSGPGPWNVYRDGTLLVSTSFLSFEDTGLMTGRTYSYQVQTASSSTSTVLYPASALSAPTPGTPVELTDIGRLWYWWGGNTSDLGPVTVVERAVPGGRQQDHLHGLIVQQDGEDPITVMNDFATAYAWVGGVSGDLGFPLEYMGGCGVLQDASCRHQYFEGGSIWSSDYTPTRPVRLLIEEGWDAAGGDGSVLGLPVGFQVNLSSGVWQRFEGGGVYWSPASGSHGVIAENDDAYTAWGGPTGPLGYPVIDEVCGLRADGCFSHFQGGSIYSTPGTGAHVMTTAIRDAWARQGWENGRLGYPVTDEVCGLRDGGCFVHFQGGSIYSTPGTGAHVMTLAIRDAWARAGWENSRLGYPVTDEVCGLRDGGCFVHFQRGSIYSTPGTGAHVMTLAIRDAWARAGWENSRLGYPVTDEVCGLRDGGCFVHFQGGSVYSGAGYGPHAINGAIRDAWARAGWENGLGYPTTDEVCGLREGGCFQHFERGSVYSSPGTGARAVLSDIRDPWARAGWENGFGYPTTDRVCGLREGGCFQHFQRGSVYVSPVYGAHAVSGVIRDTWARAGWENGLGYPTNDEFVRGGARVQTFQRGRVTVDLATGRVQVL